MVAAMEEKAPSFPNRPLSPLHPLPQCHMTSHAATTPLKYPDRAPSTTLFHSHPIHSTAHITTRTSILYGEYALKSIKLERTTKKGPSSKKGGAISSTDEAELRNEISILRSLDHPHIVHIIETYEYENRIYMVIDLCENGDLYVLDPYSEGESRGIMRQLLRAVSYMHHRGIVHRDLKVR